MAKKKEFVEELVGDFQAEKFVGDADAFGFVMTVDELEEKRKKAKQKKAK